MSRRSSSRLNSIRHTKLGRWRERRVALGSSGQATLEYLLLMIIGVILILSLLYQFNDSFRIFAEAFFDGYVRCLLETGDLPGTSATCGAEFTAFNAKAGKSLLKNNLPTAGAAGSGNAAAAAAAAKARAANSETRSGSGSGSTLMARFNNGGRGSSTVVGKSAGSESGKSASTDMDLSGMSNTVVVRRSGSGSARDRAADRAYEDGESDAAAENKDFAKPVGKKSVDGGDQLRASRVLENLQRKPATQGGDGSGDFTISGLIRLLFIILIIVALVVLIGGQLLQISRAGEKGGE